MHDVEPRHPQRVRADEVYRRDSATWVAIAALFAFGLLNAMLGPALPYLRRTEHLSYVVSALHQVAFAVGGMTAGVLATRSIAPRRRTIAAGLTCAALAGVLLGYGHVFPATLLAALLISGFGTAALIRVWGLLADLHQARRPVAMTEGEVAVSLAGVLTPAVISACAATWLSWRFASVISAVIVLAAALAVVVAKLPDTRQARTTTAASDVAGAVSSGHGPVRALTTIFAVVGLEFTLSFWAASHLHDDVDIARNTSVALVSALYAANLLGRLIASRLARRLSATTVLRISLAAAFAGLGQILAIAGIGQITGPLAAGALAQAVGLRGGLLVLPVLVLVAASTTRSAD